MTVMDNSSRDYINRAQGAMDMAFDSAEVGDGLALLTASAQVDATLAVAEALVELKEALAPVIAASKGGCNECVAGTY